MNKIKLSINNWLNQQIDDKTKHSHILEKIFYEIIEKIEENNLEIDDINEFKNDYIYFMYNNSSKTKYIYY